MIMYTQKCFNIFLERKLMLFALGFLVSLLFISGSVNAALTCSVGPSPCIGTDNVTLFKMYNTSNAHAELSGQSNYNYYVCCWGVAGLGNSSGGSNDTVVKLWGATNSHVGNKSSSYTNEVYLSGPLGVSCETIPAAGSCSGSSVCVVKISDYTNAHVSSCTASNSYLKICCSAAEDTEPPTSRIISPPAGSWHGLNSPVTDNAFNVTVIDSDNVNLSTCEFMINSSGTVTIPWRQRNCNDVFTVYVIGMFGGEEMCEDEGVNACNVSVRANDTSGNWGIVNWTLYSIDATPPSCSMNSLPPYSKGVFNVSWSGSDNYGIWYYNVQVNDTVNEWRNISDVSCVPFNQTLSTCYLGDDIYNFRCKATDYGNNTIIGWSSIVSTTVDASPPVSSFTGPSVLWINDTEFNISWDGSDDSSGLSCFDVQWRNETSSWDYMNYPGGSDTNCTANTWIIFNSTSASTTVTDNVTYYFRVRAWDTIGNNESWQPSPPMNVTVDTLPPEVNVISIQAGNIINITSITTDSISGVLNNTIYWEIKGVGNSTECGSAAHHGGTSRCSVIQSYTVSLNYVVTVIDRAGNSVTQTFLVGRMANFVMSSLHLILGGSYNVRVYVRNIDNETDNITLELSGSYPLGLVRFRDLRPWEFDYDISPDGRNLIVYDMEQYNQTSFFVYVLSSDVDEVGGTLILNATSSASGKKESDQLLIRVGYPVIFPGLNDWAVIVLIIMAVGIYYARIEKG